MGDQNKSPKKTEISRFDRMPKRNGNRGGNRKHMRGADITRTPFRLLMSQNVVATGAQITRLDLTKANLGDRVLDMGDDFEFFRVSKMHVYSFTDAAQIGTTVLASGSSAIHAIAYDNQSTGAITAPATIQQVSQFQHFKAGNFREKIAFEVPKEDLWPAGPFRWFNTFPATGSVDATESSAGTIIYELYAQGTGSLVPVTQFIVVEGIVEFHTPVDFALTMQRVRIPRNVLTDPAVKRLKEQLEMAVERARPTGA